MKLKQEKAHYFIKKGYKHSHKPSATIKSMYQSHHGTFRPFSEGDLDSSLAAKLKNTISTISQESDDYILSVGEDAYIQHLVDKAKVEPLDVLFDEITVETQEKKIPAEYFPGNYNVERGRSYDRTVLVYQIPFAGDQGLWRLRPSSYVMSGSPEISIQESDDRTGVVCFENIVFDVSQPDQQKSFVEQTKQHLITYLESQRRDIAAYNNRVTDAIRAAFGAQKDKIMKKRALVEAIGVPVKKRADPSLTFTVPPPEQRRKITIKPSASTIPFTPEPALDEETYNAILKLIETSGINMERSPSLYLGKDEEAIRDAFLFILQSHFEGTATAETFNVIGKTDILLKYQAANVFVAECKIWHGESQFLEAIDQLLGYLTYRDSKTALLIFVKNQDFQATVDKMIAANKKHAQFVAEKSLIPGHGSYCRFRLPTDPNKEISMTMMAFHFPDKTKTK